MKTNILQKSGVRYLIVGGSIYILELIIIVIAQALGASPILAVAISFWAGLIISFILQKFVTFGDRRTHHRVVLSQIIAVALLVTWNFLFTVGVTALLAHTVSATITRTIALLITTVWNFYLYKTRIFNRATSV